MQLLKILALLAFIILALEPSKVSAAAYEVGSSAMPKIKQSQEIKFDYRLYKLRKFLSKNKSPLTPYSLNFISYADYYGLDWRMVPAISGVESTFGKRIPQGSYNAYGWANGSFTFVSWPHSIHTVTRTLKKKYVDKGAVSVNKIARIYAPPSQTWGKNVNFFIGKISILPLSFDI